MQKAAVRAPLFIALWHSRLTLLVRGSKLNHLRGLAATDYISRRKESRELSCYRKSPPIVRQGDSTSLEKPGHSQNLALGNGNPETE